MRGVILAGGNGTRLHPVTQSVNKHLLPVFDKPMVYYPIATLLEFGITQIAIVTTPHHIAAFETLLGSGAHWGASFTYLVQDRPKGIPDALAAAQEWASGRPLSVILGDNIFLGTVQRKLTHPQGAQLFLKRVDTPADFGIATLDSAAKVVAVEEKPRVSQSDLAITGLYTFDASVFGKIASLVISERQELEVCDLIRLYLNAGRLEAKILPNTVAWFDAGNPLRLLQAGVEVERRQSTERTLHGSPELVAVSCGYRSLKELGLEPLEDDAPPYSRSIVEVVRRGKSRVK
jgi:glucose-1-phosphate thymidylyltransferase